MELLIAQSPSQIIILKAERGTKMSPISQFTSDARCSLCQGECWDPKDNKATQEAAKKMFGTIPNTCIPNSTGKPRCPYSKVQN